MRPLALLLLLSTLFCTACGARSELRLWDRIPFDAAIDPPECLPFEVRVPVSITVPLRAETDAEQMPTDGYAWSLRAGPSGSMARLTATNLPTATLQPDVPGRYEVVVRTPLADGDGGALQCVLRVEALPPDPQCPDDPVQVPRRTEITGSALQVALDPAFGAARRDGDATVGAAMIAADAPADDVAILAMDLPAMGSLEQVAAGIEARIVNMLGATPVLVGRAGSTGDGIPTRQSAFRVATLAQVTAEVARDRVVRQLGGLNPGVPRLGFGAATSFVIETTVILVPNTDRAVLLFASAPEARYYDTSTVTSIRLRDFTNATSVAARDRSLLYVCRSLTATRTITADFLWLVDTSSSMDDDQERLGNTAERFFAELTLAGVDFRVGVFQAGGTGPVELDSPGFAWINGAAADGPRQLAFEVTHDRYQMNRMDQRRPYPVLGGAEEPVAAGIQVISEMERRGANNPMDPRAFRPQATRVALLVSDERGSNEDMRVFSNDPMRWGATPEARVRGAAEWYRDHGILTFGMGNTFNARVCPDMDNLIACVTTLNGGAYIPLSTSTQREVESALSRIVDAIAGSSSEFVLQQVPVSSSLRVRIEQRAVPRSRAAGFDYDDAARTVNFRGAPYQPRAGQLLRAAYMTWQ